ncbi:MAG: hypothetical protein IKW13_05260 [Thermoguttaceae bacterium]|nr:hypothetical protein [Thermoguttaceae bacterium]MBR5243626.1 hypothetical protein [Thermoguttaceae bacterium]
MKNLYCAALVALSLAVVAGCSGKPSGFPKVSTCEIVVVDGGAPIEGVEVALIPETPISGVIVGGKTDASGKCVVQTTFANFSAPGAPDGSFVVTLRKDPVPTMPELTIEEMGEMSQKEIEDYRQERAAEIAAMDQIIPVALKEKATSTLKVSVPGEKTTTVDVAEYAE